MKLLWLFVLAKLFHAEEVFIPYERTSIDDFYERYHIEDLSRFASIGVSAEKKDFTQIAAIGWTLSSGSVEFNCGGSLIWENAILTAAHCTVNEDNVPPDVTHLGNVLITGILDGVSGQVRNIAHITRHPLYNASTVYYDLALLFLDRRITPDTNVIPACLWIDDEVPFNYLEAAGWGATSFYGQRLDHLIKAILQPMPNEDCAKYYNERTDKQLRYGLQDHQLCAWDSWMDTCPGDSGGPLHYKLQYGERKIPFLVGVTSFGKACGFSQPGVYVKVSKFTGWIIETLRQHDEDVQASMFEPQTCASRYVEIREYNKVIRPRNVNGVQLLWPQGLAFNNCGGILAEPDAVITLAECVTINGTAPNRVRLFGSEVIEIADIIVHTNYRERESRYYNNIAILKLKLFSTFRPQYIDYTDEINSDIAIQGIVPHGGNKSDDPKYETVKVLVTLYDKKNCHLDKQYSFSLPEGLQDEHFCFGIDGVLTPSAGLTCDLVLGSPVFSYGKLVGLTLFGRDCGYGKPAVGLLLRYYKTWLESIFLPAQTDVSAVFSYLEADLDQDSECHYSHHVEGICVPVDNCSSLNRIAMAQKTITFCSSSSVVCCPTILLNKQPTKIEKEFNECEIRYKHLLRKTRKRFPHTAAIGWHHLDKNVSAIGCFGYLISTQGVVTSATCLRKHPYEPTFVVLGQISNFTESKQHAIGKVIVHFMYDETTGEHGIGLIRLENAIEPDVHIVPACLWLNTTHAPLRQGLLDDASKEFKPVFSMYKTDCEKRLNRTNQETYCVNAVYAESCMDDQDYENKFKDCLKTRKTDRSYCFNTGSPIIWSDYDRENDIRTEYLVSVYSTGDCQADIPLRIVIPVAFYIDWFAKMLE